MSSAEDRFALDAYRSPVAYTAAMGSAWSGTARGLLGVNLANGEAHLLAECQSFGTASQLAMQLNSLLEKPKQQVRDTIEGLKLIHELRGLSEMLPGRDAKAIWKGHLDRLAQLV